MQKLLVFSASILLCVLTSTAATNRAALVTVKSDGTIAPTGAVASITQLANSAAQALAAQAAAQAVSDASTSISNQIATVEAEIASQQQHAIFRGFVTSFSSAVVPVTNCNVQILQFSTSRSGTNNYGNLATWFSTAPTNAPTISYKAMLSATNWQTLTVLSNSWPNTIGVSTTGGVYQAYATQLALPTSMSNAFFRVNGLVQYVTADGNVLPILGGVSVNGCMGLTTNIVIGGVTNYFVGGVLVTP